MTRSTAPGPDGDERSARPDGSGLDALFRALDAGDPIDSTLIADLGEEVTEPVRDRIRSVSSRLQRLERRDRELSALIASTHDLLDVRDHKGVLTRIVDRAHDLIGTDVTYMSVYVPQSHELFVRAARGVVTSSFLGMRVPAGVGIASRVVQDVAPHWVADYWRDAKISHDPQIDTILEHEKLRSLLGVPVAAGGEILGVLFAADRAVHTFSSEQIALLSAFADQAAVILRTAGLFADATKAATDAQDRADAMAAAARVHTRLTELVLAGHGPDQVAGALGDSLGRTVAITDRTLGPPAAGGSTTPGRWWQGGRLRTELRRAAESSSSSGRCVRVAGDHGCEVVAAVLAGSALLGVVIVGSGERPLSDIELRTVERSAQIAALLTMQRDAVADAEERVRGELAVDLLSTRVDTEAVRRRAHARDILLEGEWTVAAVDLPADQRHRVLREVSGHPGWLAALNQGGISVLVPTLGAEATRRASPPDVAADLRIRLGALAPAARWVLTRASGAHGLAAATQEAWHGAALLDGLGASAGPHDLQDYAPYLAMFGTDAERARAYIRRTVGGLIDWDAKHQSELIRTLVAFVDAELSATRAARTLIVHPNTVKQRLDRIAALLGEGWRAPDRLFGITVAVRLHHAVLESRET